MERKLTLTDISGYLEYPLLGQHPTGAICWIDLDFIVKNGIALAGYRPALHPISDLNKEITDKNYNDGKPFVLMDKIREISKMFEYDDCGLLYMRSGCTQSSWISIIDLFHLLRFDYRGLIPAGLAVDINSVSID